MNNIKDFLTGYLGRTLNLTNEEVAGLLFENPEGTELKKDALNLLLSKDSERVQRFKDERQTYFDNGYKKAQKEVMSDLEKKIKEQFEFDSDKQGLELIQEIVSSKINSGNQLDDDKVKVHPLFVKTVNELNKKIKETETAWQAKFDEREKSILKEKTFQGVKSKAKSIIDSLKPILPSDAQKAERQLNWFYNELGQYEFQEQDDTILVMKDGKLVEDKHGNRIAFDAIVKQIANGYWDFKQVDQRRGSGNDNNDGGQGGGQQGGFKLPADFKIPTNKEEYSKAIANAKTAEERIAIDDAFKASQKQD